LYNRGEKMSVLLWIKQQVWFFYASFGVPVCPKCGSKDIIERGYEGRNHRHDCKTCNVETFIP
jgi:transposase-like protein